MLLVASGSGCVKKHRRMRWRQSPRSARCSAVVVNALWQTAATSRSPRTLSISQDRHLLPLCHACAHRERAPTHTHAHATPRLESPARSTAIHADGRIGNGRPGRVSTPKTACPPLAGASGRRRQGRQRAPATLIVGWSQASTLVPSTQVPAVRVSWPRRLVCLHHHPGRGRGRGRAASSQPASQPSIPPVTSVRQQQGNQHSSCMHAAPPRSTSEAGEVWSGGK